PPVQLRSEKQIHPQRLLIVKIEPLAQLREIFQAGTAATEEALVRNEVNFPLAGLHSEVVKRRPIRWVGGGEDVVQKGALVIVSVLRPGLPAEQLAGELEHVIGVAGFLREIRKLGGEHVGRRAKMFAGAVAAGDVA